MVVRPFFIYLHSTDLSSPALPLSPAFDASNGEGRVRQGGGFYKAEATSIRMRRLQQGRGVCFMYLAPQDGLVPLLFRENKDLSTPQGRTRAK